MGWNELLLRQPQHALFKNIPEKAHAYFVHSFHAQCASREAIAAEVDYGGPVVAALAQDNLMGTQFHPEKSQQTGLQLLQNFLEM